MIWTATVIANVGTWMYNAASGWLMTSLNPHPLIVSLVQVATTLPIFLFAVPAGALADIVDKRRFLIIGEVAVTAVSALFAAIVSVGAATPGNLLLFTFLIGAVAAMTAPAWQSIVPQLVPKQELTPAVAANSVGFNVSRAVGPALGGRNRRRCRHSRAVLDQCHQQSRRHWGAPVVASARGAKAASAGGAFRQRYSHGLSPRAETIRTCERP